MSDDTEQGLVEIIPLEVNYAKLELRATALPYKGVEFPGEQRIKSRYYVGNPVATQTVTGPIKPPSTFTGRWMDLTLGDGQARALVLAIESLRDKAVPVEVRWGGRSLSGGGDDPAIVRRGLIHKFTPKYNRAQDVEWTLEFEWRGDVLQTKAPSFSAQIVSRGDGFVVFSDTLSETEEATTSWQDVVGALLEWGTNETLALSDALDEVQNAIVDAIDTVDGATGMLQQASELPSDVMDRVRGVSDRVVLACENGRAAFDAVCGLWPGMKGVFTGDAFVAAGEYFAQQAKRAKLAMYPTDDPLARLDGQTAQFDVVHQWDAAAELAATTAAELAAKQVPDIIAIERPPAGSDLRDLSLKHYKTVDDWIYIADFNGLATSEVPATPAGPSDLGAPPIYVPNLAYYSNQLTNLWGDV